MPHPLVLDAVEKRLADNWTACRFTLDQAPQAPAPRDGSAFLAVEFLAERGEQATIGAPGGNVYRDEGALRFVLHQPAAESYRDGLARCAALAALFRARQFDGVETFAPSPPAVDRSRSGGNYLVLALVVPYRFDHFS